MPSTVWLLFLVLLSPVPGIETNTKLNEFDSESVCHDEQERIGKEMAIAYPGDTSFRIECQSRTRKPVSTQVNYTEVLRGWADTRHPGFSYALKVNRVKKLEVPGSEQNAPKVSMVFQISLNYINGNSQSFIVFVGEDDLRVYAWVEVIVPDNDEAPTEEFPAKDQT